MEAADALIASKLLLNDHPHPENYLEMALVPTKVRIAINWRLQKLNKSKLTKSILKWQKQPTLESWLISCDPEMLLMQELSYAKTQYKNPGNRSR